MHRNTALTLIVLAAVMAAPAAFAQSNLSGNNGNGAVAGQIKVGPSFEQLVEKLEDLRARKQYDYDHGRKYQAWLAAEIDKVKQALRKHHRARGERAAKNKPMDYHPPR